MIKAVRGTRDLLPPETALWNFVEAAVRDVFRVAGTRDCHPVSNDDAGCQAIWSDTSPVGAFDFSEAPFRSLRKVLTSQTKAVTLFKSCSGTLRPHHPSLRDLRP
jgi:hypothetical protein